MQETSIKKKVFISYLEDNGSIVSAFVVLLKKDAGFITFQTQRNIIHLPSCRVLKIKESLGGD